MSDYAPSIEVLKEYEHIANWPERESALLGPVGDTMHALAAEAFWRLLAVAKEVHAEHWAERAEQFGLRP